MTRRSGIYALALLLLSLSGAAMAAAKVEFGRDGQPLGNPLENNLEALPGSNCYFSHGGTGCDDAACEATVCALDSFCCGVAWDSICADLAIANCPVDGYDWPDPPEGAEG
ncbi:MAG: hypothetical protein EHM68_15685, partial [Lysobacterales bacterium]